MGQTSIPLGTADSASAHRTIFYRYWLESRKVRRYIWLLFVYALLIGGEHPFRYSTHLDGLYLATA